MMAIYWRLAAYGEYIYWRLVAHGGYILEDGGCRWWLFAGWRLLMALKAGSCLWLLYWMLTADIDSCSLMHMANGGSQLEAGCCWWLLEVDN